MTFKNRGKMSCEILFLIFLSIAQNQAFSDLQLGVIKAMSDELNRREIIIVKNLFAETVKYDFVRMVKYFSDYKIYTTIHSVDEMVSTLNKLVIDKFPTYQYYPRTMAIISDNELPEIAEYYFNVSFNIKM